VVYQVQRAKEVIIDIILVWLKIIFFHSMFPYFKAMMAETANKVYQEKMVFQAQLVKKVKQVYQVSQDKKEAKEKLVYQGCQEQTD
jgi:hypothetical protein